MKGATRLTRRFQNQETNPTTISRVTKIETTSQNNPYNQTSSYKSQRTTTTTTSLSNKQKESNPPIKITIKTTYEKGYNNQNEKIKEKPEENNNRKHFQKLTMEERKRFARGIRPSQAQREAEALERQRQNQQDEMIEIIDKTDYSSEDLDNISIEFTPNLITDKMLTNDNDINLDDILNDKYKDINLSEEQIKKLYEEVKNKYLDKYNGNNTIINTGNVKIQISDIDSQKYSKEVSNIDLGECGEILKNKYCKSKNDSLTILKLDIRLENETSTYVQYEIYEPNSKILLTLEECTGTNVVIDVPIELNTEMESLYDWLSQSGYNLFDANDSFYNDICTPYTSNNGTDIILSDRKKEFSDNKLSLCENNCNYI